MSEPGTRNPELETDGDWPPSATLEALKLRARMLAGIRSFFSARGVLEVETPVLSAGATPDPALASLTTRYTGPGAAHGRTLYLHTSPEFPMKRLLAAGSGSIYQVCKVFRDGESGSRHNPEFTLLEWYRVGYDHHRLMDEVAELVTGLLAAEGMTLGAAERMSYRDAFLRHAGLDPHIASAAGLAAAARSHGITVPAGFAAEAERDAWLDLLLSHVVEPRLGAGRLTFVHDYPASQAALARLLPGEPPRAARFELYLGGVELANGFHELGDAAEQRARFERQHRVRAAAGLPDVPLDERLLAALAHGLPECAGVALGIDRLVMVAAGARSIDEVLAFPLARA
jgi:lysyl-tRNA synthetase class 2